MKRIFAMVLLIAFSAQTPAGVRLIGHGGGYGEMSALYALEEIPSILQFCGTQENNPCGLNDLQLTMVRRLHAHQISYLQAVRLHFATGEDSAIEMDHRDLYNQDGTPKSMAEIAALVFVAVLSPRMPAAHTVLKDLATDLFQSLEIHQQTLSLGVYKLRFVSVARGSEGAHQKLALERPESSLDLTSQFAEKLCGKAGPAEHLQWSLLNVDDTHFIGNVTARCTDLWVNARFALVPSSTDLILQIFNRSTSSGSRACDPLLE